jgi:DNA repair protein RadC
MTQIPLHFSDVPDDPKGPARGLALHDRPAYRTMTNCAGCSIVELLATVIGGPKPLETALGLLNHFGSLHNVARASAADLTQIDGIGNSAAARLIAAIEISRRLLTSEDQRQQINSPADAAAILRPVLMHRDQEFLYVLILDTRNRVIGTPREVYHGSLNTSLIRTGEVFRDAIRANGAALIVAHNHPSSDPSPSPEDVAVTRTLVEAGKLLDIQLLDHIILGATGLHVSLKDRGLGFT